MLMLIEFEIIIYLTHECTHKFYKKCCSIGEWYEDEVGSVHTCEGPEDSDCSDRWYYTSISDHMQYLGEYTCIYRVAFVLLLRVLQDCCCK